MERIAQRLPEPAPVVELDVTDQSQLNSLADRVSAHVPSLDGVLHSIGFAPATALGGDFLACPWEDVATTVHTSAYSLKSLAVACLPLMGRGGSIVGLDFDARQAWPAYDWMGVAKAALESVTRYLARELGPKGIRVNLVAAGPGEDDGGTVHPGLRRPGERVDQAGPVGMGHHRPDPGGQGGLCAAVGLVPGHQRVDGDGRRRLPRPRLRDRGDRCPGLTPLAGPAESLAGEHRPFG